MNVPIADCRLLPEESQAKKTDRSGMVSFTKVQSAARQVDIRGVNVEEGEALLDKFLDDAILAGLSEVLVIHGKGTGALRKGIRAYLKNHSHVQDIQIAEQNAGGDGATSVKLK